MRSLASAAAVLVFSATLGRYQLPEIDRIILIPKDFCPEVGYRSVEPQLDLKG